MSIKHYGVKGMHWGVRRYQNPDGTLTAEGKKQRKYRDRAIRANESSKDVDDIIKSMNKDDRDKVLAGSDHYLNLEEGSTVVKRFLKKQGDKPVAFFDLLEDGDDLQVALGTRSGKKYRGKGNTSEVTKQAMDYINKNRDKINQKNIVWGVRTDNEASIRLAEKHGFKRDEDSYSEKGDWVNYVKKVKPDTVFISGSSKTEDKKSEYYRKQLPKEVKKKIDEYLKSGDKIIVGDAPGIDRQVQRYLKKAGYDNVEIYGPGKQVRYTANKKWKTNPIDASEFEYMSPEYLRKKDIAMTNASTKGLAIVLENGGAAATRRNVQRMLQQNKQMSVFELR